MTMRMSARAKFFLYLFLIFMVILTVIPLLYTVSASFKTNMEIATGGINLIPKTFTFDNYKTVWSMSGTGIASKVTYTDYTINSIKVSLMTVVLVVLFTSMSAYCFQRGNFPGQKFLYWLFMATMFIGAGTVTMFPLLRITTKLGLNNLPGLALVQFGTAGASDLFLTMGYLKTISKELDDAAKIDGCGYLRTIWLIAVPMVVPALSICVILNFISGWNDLFTPMVLIKDMDKQLVMPALSHLVGRFSKDVPSQMTGMLIASVPAVAVYLLLQKKIIMGVSMGAIK